MFTEMEKQQKVQEKKEKKILKVKVFEFGHVRIHNIDLNAGKDRQKLSYILTYEKHKLRNKDRVHYEEQLNKHKKANKSNNMKFSALHATSGLGMHEYSDKRFTY